ncbi:MAG: hypothetical protein QXS68_05790 [Candidatus Methanomethylicaceae archaeon]
MKFDQITQDLHEIKEMLKEVESRVRRLENYEAGAHPLLENKLEAAWRKIDENSRKIEDHERRFEKITSLITKMDQTNKILTWLGGILGSTVLVWLITQILEVVGK